MPTYTKDPTTMPLFQVTPGQLLHTATNVVSVLTGDLTLNTVIPLVRLPRGARVVDGVIYCTDMDTSGSPTLAFHVGDSGDNDRYATAIAASAAVKIVFGGAAATAATTATAGAYTADTTINATVSTASATAAAGTMWVTIMYVME